MNCREFIDVLDDFVAGDLPGEAAAACAAHASRCPDCAAYLHSYRETLRLAKESGRDDDPPSHPPRAAQFRVREFRRMARDGLWPRFGWGVFAPG